MNQRAVAGVCCSLLAFQEGGDGGFLRSRFGLLFAGELLLCLYQAVEEVGAEESDKGEGVVFQLERAQCCDVAGAAFCLDVDGLVAGVHEDKVADQASCSAIGVHEGMDALELQVEERGYQCWVPFAVRAAFDELLHSFRNVGSRCWLECCSGDLHLRGAVDASGCRVLRFGENEFMSAFDGGFREWLAVRYVLLQEAQAGEPAFSLFNVVCGRVDLDALEQECRIAQRERASLDGV